MATIGHVAAGIALARAGRRTDALSLGLITVASVAPDLDLLIDVEHRGPTHSVAFALLVGGLVYGALRIIGRAPDAATVAALTVMAVILHAVLDALTAHAPVAIAWPISDYELVLPWTPLPTAPAGPDLISSRGLILLALEMAWSAALILLPDLWLSDPTQGNGRRHSA